MTPINNNTFVGASATTLWTLRNRADGVLDDPWAVDLFGLVGAVDYGYADAGHTRGRGKRHNTWM